MRRWLFMAALSVALLAVPLWGQRGGRGGMAMGGVRGGYVVHGGGFMGPSHGGYWSGGFRPVYGPGFPGHPGHYPYHPIHYPYWGWRYPWWGFRGYYGYPWALGSYGGVGFGWSDAYYPAQSYPAYAYAPPENSNANIAYQQQGEIDRLNDEVASLRAERVPSAPATQAPETQIRAETVLVFRDHHSEQIQNYAIVGETLWVFTEQRARKIPISTLDVPATSKANDDRGIDFRLPSRRQLTP